MATDTRIAIEDLTTDHDLIVESDVTGDRHYATMYDVQRDGDDYLVYYEVDNELESFYGIRRVPAGDTVEVLA
jgi:hypothetical protein